MPSSVRDPKPETGVNSEPPDQARLKRLVLVSSWIVLAILSFFQFPGHTILQSDTQIYIPMLERLWDPSTFSRDIMAVRPHVTFTLYDEAALALRAISGAGFEQVLMAQQFCYRLVGIAALYFIASAAGLGLWYSLFVTAVVSLGATISGPAVLTVEYEPVPRGFALPFLLASIACVAHSRWRLAAACATIAFGFHPPTAVAYCGLLGLLLIRQRRFAEIGVLAITPVLMLLSAVAFDSSAERQPIFQRIDPALEELQRLRASYCWVSIWLSNFKYHYLLLYCAGMIALWRIRGRFSTPVMWILAGLPLIGLLSVPLSYRLTEQLKWAMMPQFQPSRYLMFVTLTAAIACAISGVVAAERRRWIEAILLLTIAFAIPMDAKVTNVLAPDLGGSLALNRLGLAVSLALIATAAAALGRLSTLSRLAPAGLVAAAVLPFILIPSVGQVRNYLPLHHAATDDLAQWARHNTSKDALFQFADSGRELQPGVFRARATRALFADWKAGGQVNFHKQFSEIWWQRWQMIEKPQPLDRYAALGIDYVIFKASSKRSQEAAPVYSNSNYIVYKVR
jgi:hypothetical protein